MLVVTNIHAVEGLPARQDTNKVVGVEFHTDLSFGSLKAGHLYVLRIGDELWIPLESWLQKAGYTVTQPRENRGHYEGYAPLKRRRWRIPLTTENATGSNASLNQVMWTDSTCWVRATWITKHYGLVPKFREQALELTFAGSLKAPVQEWHDLNRDKMERMKVSLTESRNQTVAAISSALFPNRSPKVGVRPGLLQLQVQRRALSTRGVLSYEVLGHAFQWALRGYGSLTADLATGEADQKAFRGSASVSGLEMATSWGRNQRLAFTLGPEGWGLQLEKSLRGWSDQNSVAGSGYLHRWNADKEMLGWRVNRGPMTYIGDTLPNRPPTFKLESGTNQLEYLKINRYGGISQRTLWWSIPVRMLPYQSWTYQVRAGTKSGIESWVCYGIHPRLSLLINVLWDKTLSSVLSEPSPVGHTPMRPPSYLTAKIYLPWSAGPLWNGQSTWVMPSPYARMARHDNPASKLNSWAEHTLNWQKGPALRAFLRVQHGLWDMGRAPWWRYQGQVLCQLPPRQGPGTFQIANISLELPWQAPGERILPDKRPQEYLPSARFQLEWFGQWWMFQVPEKSWTLQGRLHNGHSSRPLWKHHNRWALVYQWGCQQGQWFGMGQLQWPSGHQVGLGWNGRTPQGMSAASWTVEWRWQKGPHSRAFKSRLSQDVPVWEWQQQWQSPGRGDKMPLSPPYGQCLVRLSLYGDGNGNGCKDPDESSLDCEGGLQAPAGLPVVYLPGGDALLGPSPNHCRIRVGINEEGLKAPGWLSPAPSYVLQPRPHTTTHYRIGLVPAMEITGYFLNATNRQALGGWRLLCIRRSDLDSCSADLLKDLFDHRVPASTLKSTITQSDGYFEFGMLAPGDYLLLPDPETLRRLHLPLNLVQPLPVVLGPNQESADTRVYLNLPP